MISMNYYDITVNAYRAGARASLYSWVGKFWKKLKGLKARLGIYGDILVFALVWWSVQEYVPYGDLLTTGLMYLFGAMVVFSVCYIAWARVRNR